MRKDMNFDYKKTLCKSIKNAKVFALSSLLVMASETFAQQQMVNIPQQQLTLKELFKQIEKQTQFSIGYNHSKISKTIEKKVKVSSGDVKSILDKALAGTGLTYSFDGNHIVITPKDVTPSAVGEKKEIRGNILDAKGEPVIGATVMEKGTTNGTITDYDGNFVLQAHEGGSIEVSYIGYQTQMLTAVSGKTMSVILKEDTEVLDEVVVTALGIKREEKALGYSVQKIKADDITAVKGVTVASSLTGKVSGLQVNNSSEISELASLSLRGSGPLIVIDGIAYGNPSLADVSAEDIESIDVLKGATASALYGSRGSGGAVMITTKKAKEGKITINVSNNTMFSAGFLKMPENQHSYSAGNYGKLEYDSEFVWGEYMDGHEALQYDPITKGMKMMPLLPRGKDNLKNFIRPQLTTNTNVNISQSGEKGGFRLSATHIHQNSQYPGSKIDKFRLSGTGNVTYGKLKLEASFNYNRDLSPNMPKTNYGGGNILYNMLIWGGTEYDVRDYKDYWKVENQSQNWPYENSYDNPYFLVNERVDKRNNSKFNTGITATYSFLDNLSVTLRSGYDHYDNNAESRRSMGDTGSKRGYYDYAVNRGESLSADLIINGNYSWNDFSVNGIFGASSYWYKDENFSSWTRGGLSIPGFYSLKASVEKPGTSKSISEKVTYSMYGKFGISWKNGVFVDVTGRNDWSSTLPSNSRSYFYPSVSTSVLPTAFYNPIPEVLDMWKIRASWTVSKSDLGIYELNKVYNLSTDVWDGLNTASYPGTIRDPNIKPSKETSWEFGTNFRFFKNRLFFDYTYFTKLQSNRTVKAGVSDATGFGSKLTNTKEEFLQKGMEFTLGGKPVVTSDFAWESIVNVSFWHWYYHQMDPEFSTKDPRITKGSRYDQYFATDWARDSHGNMIFQAGLPVKNNFSSVIGHSDPSAILGWTNTFSYKNWSMSVSIDGRIGGKMFSWTEQAMWNSGSHPDSDNKWRYDEVVNHKQNYIAEGVKVVSGTVSYDPYGKVLEDNRVFAPNDVAVSYQSYVQKYNENAWDHNATQNILDASFIKLREVAVNYTFPKGLIQKFHFKDLRVGIVGQNLWMWAKDFRYSDPDRGYENLNSPTSRYIGFNINLTM